ncbi:hypothetical protein [Stella sp.]|uniref:hypothetical protein n=1 Tax=Stella sp. TaxID=2912054 RepID=UPI0035B05A47
MDQPSDFLEDRELAYATARRVFRPGEHLEFDPSYRLCHLPLVAPGHPLAIRSAPGRAYVDGRYEEPRRALVVPVSWPALAASPAFRALEDRMAAAAFAGKIAWDLGRRRRPHLHATLAGGLTDADVARLARELPGLLAELGPIRIRLGGPLVGDRNWGRIYLPLYPERVAGSDPFRRIQGAAGAPAGGFYGVGYYHLTDPLDPAETAALAAILDEWRATPVAEVALSHLELHATHDDLVLSGRTLATIPAPQRPGRQPQPQAISDRVGAGSPPRR